MPVATWWRGDPVPELPPLPTFSARVSDDERLLERLTGLSRPVIGDRLRSDNLAYVASLDDVPVAYGWMAKREGGIEELRFSFSLPPRNCYLWDFVTLPEWRGRGVYPRLLQAIVQRERAFDRFWIGFEPGNDASARGISKAGFRLVGDLSVFHSQASGFILYSADERGNASAAIFKLPVLRGQPPDRAQ